MTWSSPLLVIGHANLRPELEMRPFRPISQRQCLPGAQEEKRQRLREAGRAKLEEFKSEARMHA